jgi:hypothetical protein
MERDNFCCIVCFDKENSLNVHHRYYEFGKDPWDYDNDVLVTLCDKCHGYEHDYMKEASERITKELKKRFFSHDLINIANALNKSTFLHVDDVISAVICKFFTDQDFQQNALGDYFRVIQSEYTTKDSD